MAGNKLTPQQKKFADEWLIDNNGTRAYRAAYPAVKKEATAKSAASRLLTNVNVNAYLQKQQAKLAYKYEISQERVLKEEMCIAYSDLGEIFNGPVLLRPDQLPERIRRAISSFKITKMKTKAGELKIQYEYKFWSKGNSLNRIEKHLGMFEEDNKQRGIPLQELFEAMKDVDPDLAAKIKEKLLSGTADSK